MLRIAVAGSPHSTPGSGGSLKGIARAIELGIHAMELEWVQRVPLNPEHMGKIRTLADENDFSLTVHAPYYVNLNAIEPEKLEASKKRVLDALSMAQLAGARSVCVHPAFYLSMDPKIVLENVLKATAEIMSYKQKLFPDVNLAYETMGKLTQFGTLEEVLILSKEFGLYPTIDPAHMHARSNGAWNTKEEWREMLDTYKQFLGEDSLQNVHMHYSGIEYTQKGERRHVPLLESDAKWQDFLSVLIEYNVSGTVVCESPLLEEDTLRMAQEYNSQLGT